VRTALGDYQRLATGGDETDDGEELGSVYTPEGDSLTGQINPDFNGYVPSSEEPDEGYLFTNWEHRPGAMTRVHLQQNGRNGTCGFSAWRISTFPPWKEPGSTASGPSLRGAPR